MKLRRLTGSSTVKEAMTYLQKRHPLYFVPSTMNKEQVTDLLNRLIYRLKQKEELQASAKKENEEKPMFKAGNALPAVEDAEPEQPKDKLADKAKQMFDDLDDYDDDFEESGASKGAGNDFNANELLNFSDYQNRRRETTNQSGALNIKDVLNGSAAQKLNDN